MKYRWYWDAKCTPAISELEGGNQRSSKPLNLPKRFQIFLLRLIMANLYTIKFTLYLFYAHCNLISKETISLENRICLISKTLLQQGQRAKTQDD